MPPCMFAMYRAKEEHSILFVKIVIWSFEKQQIFRRRQFRSFDGGSVKIKTNQGPENFVLVSLGAFFVHFTVTFASG